MSEEKWERVTEFVLLVDRIWDRDPYNKKKKKKRIWDRDPYNNSRFRFGSVVEFLRV